MDFDEYEYLEKTVEETESRSKKKEIGSDKREKGYRKRGEDLGDDHRGEDEEEDERKRKKSRNEDENGGGERKRDDRERRREKEDRHRDRDRDRGRSKDLGEREREKDREKDRDRERSRDGGEREREKERERRERREREREKEKKERDTREKDSEREKEKEKEREREKEKEKEKEREREKERRSSSRSRRHDSREREKSRERERELREMESRESRRFKEKKEAVEPEADPERDQRTVFAYQMPLKATERDVYEFFSKAGKVRDVRLIMDRNSRRSKGVGNAIKISMMRDDGKTLLSCLINSCSILKPVPVMRCRYIEFYDAMSVPMAITLSGQLLLGQPVMVKPSEAEKNLVQSTASTGTSVTGPYGPTDRKLYVGNLHFNMTEQQLRQIFESFGPVELVQLPLDLETGHCKGFGFVQFAQVEHAKAAQGLNGKIEIAGRYIKVSSVTEHVGGQEVGTTAADFDDDDGGGLSLNARSRALLMQKLDRTGTATSVAGTLGVPVVSSTASVQQAIPMLNGHTAPPAPTLPGQVLSSPVSEPVGTPSECLLLKNLFDPATETDPEFDLDIKEDVEEECSKFGPVRHIYVDKHSAGHVYLRFDNTEGAMNAQRGMHMRWFARRLISAIFMQPQEYEAKFPA